VTARRHPTIQGATGSPLELARRISDDLLFPSALEVDRARAVPVERLDRLAAAGLYGLAGPADAGGMGLTDPRTGMRVLEILAGGCLTTTFVWMQHHGAVRAVAAGPPGLRAAWLERLCRGQVRAAAAFSGLRRPGPPLLVARAVEGGWALDGLAAWVTGWGRVDVVHVGARTEAGDVVWLLADAVTGPTLTAERLDLAAVGASSTVTLRFHDHRVTGDRVTGSEPHQAWAERDRASLRSNGSLALGVAGRCLSLLGPSRLDVELTRSREELDGASPDEMPRARAAASALALEAAAALVTAGGGRSILRDQHAQRLAREALFLLVFGQTPVIRRAQMERAGIG